MKLFRISRVLPVSVPKADEHDYNMVTDWTLSPPVCFYGEGPVTRAWDRPDPALLDPAAVEELDPSAELDPAAAFFATSPLRPTGDVYPDPVSKLRDGAGSVTFRQVFKLTSRRPLFFAEEPAEMSEPDRHGGQLRVKRIEVPWVAAQAARAGFVGTLSAQTLALLTGRPTLDELAAGGILAQMHLDRLPDGDVSPLWEKAMEAKAGGRSLAVMRRELAAVFSPTGEPEPFETLHGVIAESYGFGRYRTEDREPGFLASGEPAPGRLCDALRVAFDAKGERTRHPLQPPKRKRAKAA